MSEPPSPAASAASTADSQQRQPSQEQDQLQNQDEEKQPRHHRRSSSRSRSTSTTRRALAASPTAPQTLRIQQKRVSPQAHGSSACTRYRECQVELGGVVGGLGVVVEREMDVRDGGKEREREREGWRVFGGRDGGARRRWLEGCGRGRGREGDEVEVEDGGDGEGRISIPIMTTTTTTIILPKGEELQHDGDHVDEDALVIIEAPSNEFDIATPPTSNTHLPASVASQNQDEDEDETGDAQHTKQNQEEEQEETANEPRALPPPFPPPPTLLPLLPHEQPAPQNSLGYQLFGPAYLRAVARKRERDARLAAGDGEAELAAVGKRARKPEVSYRRIGEVEAERRAGRDGGGEAGTDGRKETVGVEKEKEQERGREKDDGKVGVESEKGEDGVQRGSGSGSADELVKPPSRRRDKYTLSPSPAPSFSPKDRHRDSTRTRTRTRPRPKPRTTTSGIPSEISAGSFTSPVTNVNANAKARTSAESGRKELLDRNRGKQLLGRVNDKEEDKGWVEVMEKEKEKDDKEKEKEKECERKPSRIPGLSRVRSWWNLRDKARLADMVEKEIRARDGDSHAYNGASASASASFPHGVGSSRKSRDRLSSNVERKKSKKKENHKLSEDFKFLAPASSPRDRERDRDLNGFVPYGTFPPLDAHLRTLLPDIGRDNAEVRQRRGSGFTRHSRSNSVDFNSGTNANGKVKDKVNNAKRKQERNDEDLWAQCSERLDRAADTAGLSAWERIRGERDRESHAYGPENERLKYWEQGQHASWNLSHAHSESSNERAREWISRQLESSEHAYGGISNDRAREWIARQQESSGHGYGDSGDDRAREWIRRQYQRESERSGHAYRNDGAASASASVATASVGTARVVSIERVRAEAPRKMQQISRSKSRSKSKARSTSDSRFEYQMREPGDQSKRSGTKIDKENEKRRQKMGLTASREATWDQRLSLPQTQMASPYSHRSRAHSLSNPWDAAYEDLGVMASPTPPRRTTRRQGSRDEYTTPSSSRSKSSSSSMFPQEEDNRRQKRQRETPSRLVPPPSSPPQSRKRENKSSVFRLPARHTSPLSSLSPSQSQSQPQPSPPVPAAPLSSRPPIPLPRSFSSVLKLAKGVDRQGSGGVRFDSVVGRESSGVGTSRRDGSSGGARL